MWEIPRERTRPAQVRGSNPLAGSRFLGLSPTGNYPLDDSRVTFYYRQQDPGGPIGHGAALLPLLNGALRESEPFRKLRLCKA